MDRFKYKAFMEKFPYLKEVLKVRRIAVVDSMEQYEELKSDSSLEVLTDEKYILRKLRDGSTGVEVSIVMVANQFEIRDIEVRELTEGILFKTPLHIYSVYKDARNEHENNIHFVAGGKLIKDAVDERTVRIAHGKCKNLGSFDYEDDDNEEDMDTMELEDENIEDFSLCNGCGWPRFTDNDDCINCDVAKHVDCKEGGIGLPYLGETILSAIDRLGVADALEYIIWIYRHSVKDGIGLDGGEQFSVTIYRVPKSMNLSKIIKSVEEQAGYEVEKKLAL